MTFKEFVKWCNQRSCDGCWSMGTAIFCIDLMTRINKEPWWKRNRVWERRREYVETNIISVIEEKIKKASQSG